MIYLTCFSFFSVIIKFDTTSSVFVVCPFVRHTTYLTFHLFKIGNIICPTYHFIAITVIWHPINTKTMKGTPYIRIHISDSSNNLIFQTDNLNKFIYLYTYSCIYLFVIYITIHLFVMIIEKHRNMTPALFSETVLILLFFRIF